ncbi:histidine phosphatase family protein [Pseudalkalibacillus caeni]|uniref:Histidine phosphatase family protein n=1 Tax=Exobacillus caeni TaxID=2574798 RepID=A0A5R9F7T2_9BACL|nr:histidine phosphatase family protein [Pseudalkalibacillus caeni]TLS38310.1 histidine phosphatase family protein [Pseudalkalibacillus caeni]
MATNVYFVRHAHSTYTPDERKRPLSDRGYIDAKKVTELLADHPIEVIISSPYKRAFQTVEGLANRLGKEIKIVEEFKERTLSGEPVENFEAAIEKVWKEERFAFPGGESNLEAQAKGVRAFKQVLDEYAGKNIVIGTHGNIMVLIMKFFNPGFDVTFWKKLDMPDIYCLTFDNGKLAGHKRIWQRD